MKSKKKIEDIPFEEYLGKLEEIVHRLEEGELTLDESVKVYEEGMNITKICLEKLNKTKKKIEQLVIEGEENYSTKPFSDKEGEDTINGL
ncbi:MAG: exodeoxyribonuclease VII small subunit [Candidatus Caldatribacteriota bacterium]|nr:exodeoxyribonuclease VII small subunit [Candidatus Caldatribacteriota bacterium]